MKKISFILFPIICLTLVACLSTKNVKNGKKPSYGVSLSQINASSFVEKGLTGKGVKIGIIDVGFSNANTEPLLEKIFAKKSILGVKDFFNPVDSIYAMTSETDWHGTVVWCQLGGENDSKRFGIASDSKFYLARTDHGAKEFRGEQQNFKEALDWLDSQGVRLVNVSIGYSFGFDNPEENYVPEDMNGKTTLISKAVEKAIKEKNMIIVTSAGNQGNSVWKIVSAPADAPSVISVGSVTEDGRKESYSSEGPDFLPNHKPNVSCFNSVGGTSFSAPVITGLIAGMLQMKPDLTNDQVTDILEKSSSLYPFGNSYIGYGIPNGDKVLQLLENGNAEMAGIEKLTSALDSIVLDRSGFSNKVIILHKKDSWSVLRQDTLDMASSTFTVRRPKRINTQKLIVDDKVNMEFHFDEVENTVQYSTVMSLDKSVEISWE